MSSFTLWKGNNNRAHVLANALAFISQLPDTQSYEIEVTLKRKERTDPQNHALFGVAYKTISAETGHTKDELHEAFCKRFFGTVTRNIFGTYREVPYRTTTTDENGKRDVIDTLTFANFYAEVQRIAAEASIFVPDPEKQWRDVA